MWNVYQYCVDFKDNKIDFKEFINIYKDQRPLKSFIFDMYNETISDSNLKNKYLSKGGLIFPYKTYKTIEEFIVNINSFNDVKKIIKILIEIFDEKYRK